MSLKQKEAFSLMKKIIPYFNKRKRKFFLSYEKLRFNYKLNRLTKSQREMILNRAERDLAQDLRHGNHIESINSNNPIVLQGLQLRKDVFSYFHHRHRQHYNARILIHVPSANSSPAGYSLFSNLVESLNFLGIQTEILDWNSNCKKVIGSFRPNILLTSEDDSYINRIDWKYIEEYKASNPLKVGITAPLLNNDSIINLPKLKWAKDNCIDFLYSFRDKDFSELLPVYGQLKNEGFPILNLPWGANILHYFPIEVSRKDLNYVLLASRKREHIEFLAEISNQFSGFIDGPGWSHIHNFTFNRQRDKYIYARAKVGLNIHLSEQINKVYELNERTFQLAACGVPQLIDNPLLLNKFFSKDAIFSADSPSMYTELFKMLINNPELGQNAALIAQKEVFLKHTTFHRAESFLLQLNLLKLLQ